MKRRQTLASSLIERASQVRLRRETLAAGQVGMLSNPKAAAAAETETDTLNEMSDLADTQNSNNAILTDAPLDVVKASSAEAGPMLDRATFLHIHRQRARYILAQVFGFDASDLMDDIINAVFVIMYQALEAFEEFVVDSVDGDSDVAEEGIIASVTLLENAVDKTLDKVEIYLMNNIFMIPDNVSITLQIFQNVETALLDEEEAELDAEILALQKRLAASRHYNKTLKKAIACGKAKNASLTLLLSSLQKSTAANTTPTIHMKKEHEISETIQEMESCAIDVGTLLAQQAANSAGDEFEGAGAGGDAAVLSDMISGYLKAQRDTDNGHGSSTSALNAGDVRKFLEAIKVGGVASVADMEAAKEIGMVPEGLSRVKWGCANAETV
ncbi:Mis12 protein-domain-containing protein [Chytriomyces cf. hyalinus JEL632]|nr:Mis12 protein-domain-containing protein [Chytriomyces cf. hyalinus JEL632]